MKVELISGFLGSGKTSLIKSLIAHWTGTEKLAVLVNEFGEIGIDGALLAVGGTDVVELASGCICCTLNADLRAQVADLAQTYKPERLLVEPTGVATTKNILNILRSLSLEEFVESIRVTLLLDSLSFDSEWQGGASFLAGQIALADYVVLNKSDLVPPEVIEKIRLEVKKINPQAVMISDSFGRETAEVLGCRELEGAVKPKAAPDRVGDRDDAHLNIDYQSTGVSWQGPEAAERLEALFQGFCRGYYGQVVRAKALFLDTENRWEIINFVQGEIYRDWVDVDNSGESRLTVIGKDLNKELIKTATAQFGLGRMIRR